jgi:RHS repeat-associated protein
VHGAGSLGYGSDGLNRMTSWGSTGVGHDARGNMTSDGRDRAFTFSSENLLTRNTQPSSGAYADYRYDPLMRFDGSVTGSGFQNGFLFDGHDLIAEYSNGQLTASHVHVPGEADEPLASIDAAGTRRWFHGDERGSVIAGSLGDGTVQGVNIYDEYGRVGWNWYRFQYAGAPILNWDLLYLRNRVYDAENGRFLQPDPAGYVDGPNAYSYAGGDPVNSIDVEGTRRATIGERKYLNRVYGGILDISRIDIRSSPLDRSFVFGSTIFFSHNVYSEDFSKLNKTGFSLHTFNHEVGHQFELQLGLTSMSNLIMNQAAAMGGQFVYNTNVKDAWGNQVDYKHLNPEARPQALANCLAGRSFDCDIMSTFKHEWSKGGVKYRVTFEDGAFVGRATYTPTGSRIARSVTIGGGKPPSTPPTPSSSKRKS